MALCQLGRKERTHLCAQRTAIGNRWLSRLRYQIERNTGLAWSVSHNTADHNRLLAFARSSGDGRTIVQQSSGEDEQRCIATPIELGKILLWNNQGRLGKLEPKVKRQESICACTLRVGAIRIQVFRALYLWAPCKAPINN